MRKKFFAIIAGNFLICAALAQPGSDEKNHAKGRNNDVSLHLNYPFGGYLKDISNFGTGIEYAWSQGRFGRMSAKPSKPVGFTFNLGIDYYFGEKEKYGNNTVKYKGTTYLHAYGGAIYNPCNTGNISLAAGPAVELYDGNSEFGFGINLSGTIYPFKCGNYGINETGKQ
jgi:hypothetical protein